jgi:2-dehydro-3-deoxyphosphogluconate aldolase/(4S)-4-hydroxy-2-oxoglutarate aldolase
MTAMPTPQVFHHLSTVRILPVVSLPEPDVAAHVTAVLANAGLPIVEITLRTDRALDAVSAATAAGRALVGIGTVTRPEQVSDAVDAGAQFVVTPGFDPTIVRAYSDRAIPLIPGVATATEIQAALAAGLSVLKLFPAEALGGWRTIRALSAPYPQVRFVPTGGITARASPHYLAEPSVLAVGGSWMVPPDALLGHDMTAIGALSRAAARAAVETPGTQA